MRDRPKIGLTMRLELETRRYYLGRDYSEALFAAGAAPVHLALIPDREYVRAVLSDLDGILLPGSDTDVDPDRFGEDPHPKLKKVIFEKDETDLLVLEEAERLGLPVLCICYGMQALNVYRGGSLIQDIEAQVAGNIKHEQGTPLAPPSHRIKVDADSLLFDIVGETEVKVNSHHHQAIGRIGKDLRASACAADGVVECIEDVSGDYFAIGVQWHPELGGRDDRISVQLFDRFVGECKARREFVTDRGVVRADLNLG